MAPVDPATRPSSLKHVFTVTNVILGMAGIYYIGMYSFILYIGVFGEDARIYGPTWVENLYAASTTTIVAIGVTLLCAMRWRLASLVTVVALTYAYFFITVLQAETHELAPNTGSSSYRVSGLIFTMTSVMIPTVLIAAAIFAERLAAKKQRHVTPRPSDIQPETAQ